MKVKVKKQFRDKYTKALYKEDQIIELANERYEEINSTAYGVLVEAIRDEKTENDAVNDEEIKLEDMAKKEIVEYAKSKGIELNSRMTKEEMIEELTK